MNKENYKEASRRARLWSRILPASKCVTPKCVAIRRIVGTAY